MSITAAILCGGKGSRLWPVIGLHLPKCLAPVAGRPFLGYVLDHLRKTGVKKVVLLTNTKTNDQIIAFATDYVEALGEGDSDFTITSFPEASPLGTGGALRNALPLLDSDPVLVLNGDTYCEFSVEALLQARQKAGLKNLALCVSEWRKNVRAGVYLLSRDFIAELPEGESLSLDEELNWIAEERKITGRCDFIFKEPFIDIGTPDDYAEAEGFLRMVGVL